MQSVLAGKRLSPEVDEDGFPPAHSRPTDGACLEPEPLSADRIIVVWMCPTHGA